MYRFSTDFLSICSEQEILSFFLRHGMPVKCAIVSLLSLLFLFLGNETLIYLENMNSWVRLMDTKVRNKL